MIFADGTTQTTVTLPAPTDGTTLARQELVVRSTGRLQENGSQLGLLRVAIHTNKVRQYASLLSTDTFTALAGQYVNTLATDAPPINLGGLTPQQNLLGNPVWPQTASHSFLISNAYAAEESSLAWDVFNFFIPVESIGVLVEQLQYLVSDPEKFDATEFIIALVDTITILPPAKPLKAFTRPLQAMTKALRPLNPKFTKHFAGAFGKMWSKIKKGDTDTLLNLLPFLVIAAEMYSDEEARKGLEFLVKTVASPDDIIAWIDYLALPADGWEGEGPPPQVEAFPDAEQTTSASPFGFLMSEAYAAGSVTKLNRAIGKVVGKNLGKLAGRMTKGEAKDLPSALRILGKELPQVGAADLRKYVFSPAAMRSTAFVFIAAGARSLKNFARGHTDARYSRPVIIATMAYLAWEASCGVVIEGLAEVEEGETAPTPQDLECELGRSNGPTGLNMQVREQITRKALRLFGDALTGPNLLEELPAQEESTKISPTTIAGHAALFHLVQTAFYQLQHRFVAGSKPIKFLERQRWVTLQSGSMDPNIDIESQCKDSTKCIYKRSRNVDIVLGEGAIIFSDGVYRQSSIDKPETWVELKSWEAQSETGEGRYRFAFEKNPKAGGNLVPWEVLGKGGKRNDTTHLQFSLDRAAAKLEHAWLSKGESSTQIVGTMQAVEDIQWRFQAFKVYKPGTKILKAISPKLGKASIQNSFRSLVHKRPEIRHDKESVVHSYTFKNDAEAFEKKAALTGPKDLVDLMVKAGFEEIKDLTDDLEGVLDDEL